MSAPRFDWVTVYSYKCWNEEVGRHLDMPHKATIDALARIDGCTPIEVTGETVLASAIDVNGLYRPPSYPASDMAGSSGGPIPDR